MGNNIDNRIIKFLKDNEGTWFSPNEVARQTKSSNSRGVSGKLRNIKNEYEHIECRDVGSKVCPNKQYRYFVPQ